MAKNTNKNKLRIFLEVVFWLIFSVLIGFIFFIKVSSSNTNLPFKSFLIQSGSMEPTIMTGDVILVQKSDTYKQRDVITYYDHGKRVVTHRILEVNQGSQGEEYITQGDNNQTPDIAAVPKTDVIGKHYLTIPKLGYLIAKSKTKAGIILLIVIPASIIIYDEIKKIKTSVENKKTEKKD